MSDEELPFDPSEFDFVFFEVVAKMLVPLFRAFKAEGLSGQEAAALAAAYAQQFMPVEGEGPTDGS